MEVPHLPIIQDPLEFGKTIGIRNVFNNLWKGCGSVFNRARM
jgi:hypothetical protein